MSGVFQNIDPPPPQRPASVYLPSLVGEEDTLAGWKGGWGVNILEDARHSSVPTLQYICKHFVCRTIRNLRSLTCRIPWLNAADPIIADFFVWVYFSAFYANVVKNKIFTVLRIWIQDPVPFWPMDPGSGMGKKSGSGFGMNNLDHISECVGTIFWVKIVKFLDADPGSGMEKIRIQIRDQGSGMEKNTDLG